jgi:hypothetical protein
MTDPILYACLEDLRERMLLLRSDAGVKIVEETIKELKRLNGRIQEMTMMSNRLKDREKPNLDEVDFGAPHWKEE